MALRELTILDPQQASTFLVGARGDRLEALYTVALTLGLRQGEALGLRWSHVDLAAHTMTVREAMQRVGKVGDGGGLTRVETKSASSRRTLALPPVIVLALNAHRARHDDEGGAGRWDDHGLVFCTRYGTPFDGPNVTKYFQRHLKAAGLPKLPFHGLRHSCASLLAAQGYALFEVSRLLGHSDIRLTANLYAHLFPEARGQMADAMEWAFAREEAEDAAGDDAATRHVP